MIPGSATPFLLATSGDDGYKIDRSLRFDSSSSSYLNRTPSSAGNRKAWTWSGWVKRTVLGADKFIFSAGSDPANMHYLRFKSNDTLEATEKVGDSVQSSLVTSAVYRDPSAWYHIVYVYDSTQSTAADRLSLYVNGVKVTAFGTSTYPSQNHDSYINSTSNHFINARPNPAAYSDFYLTEIQLLDGTAVSDASDFGELDDNNVWQPKKYSGSYGTNGFHLDFSDNSSNAALGNDAAGSNNWTVNNLIAQPTSPTNINFDSSWTVTTNNGGVGTASISGNVASAASGKWSGASSASALSTNSVSTAGFTTGSAGNTWFGLGKKLTTNYNQTIRDSSQSYGLYTAWDGSSANNPGGHGTSITATGFSNGDLIKFEVDPGNSTLKTYKNGALQATDTLSSSFVSAIQAGDIYWQSDQYSTGSITLTNGVASATADSLIDTPTNYEASSGNNGGNYATLNPLQSGATLANGNLDATSGQNKAVFATIAVGKTGKKFYWEATINDSHFQQIGVADMAVGKTSTAPGDSGSEGYIYLSNGEIYHDGATTSTGHSTYTTGDIIGIKYDDTTRSLSWNKNGGSFFGAVTVDDGRHYAPVFGAGGGSDEISVSVNFGQLPFSQTVPTGYSSLCTTNLDPPLIADGSTAMDIATYTGNATTNTAITGLNHSPDLLWIKSRSSTQWHFLADTIRGNTKNLASNATDAEETRTNRLLSFDSNGFTIGNNSTVNENNATFVAWAWDAGTSNTSVSAGSLNSSAYNQTDWSGSTTTTNIATNTGNDLASVFDGNLANGTRAANNGGTGTLQWSSGTIQGNVRVYTGLAGTQGLTYYNGSTSTTIASVNNGWNDLGNIDLTRLDFVYSGGNITFVNGIELDGKLLVQTGVTLTNVPSIASTVRANPSAGFSIVSWTGTANAGTIGHGLNTAPEFIIAKNRDANDAWYCYHSALGNAARIQLNETSAQTTGSSQWNSTSPTSAVFSVGAGSWQASGNNLVTYCFAPVEGYSAFGSYTGNGSSDGPFVFTGFKVAWLMYKRTDSTNSWQILDTTRDPVNVNNLVLIANLGNSESTGTGNNDQFDMLSNGFKVRSSNHAGNASGGTYIYLAFASHPFKTARSR